MDSIRNSVEEFLPLHVSSNLIIGSEMVAEWGKGIGSWFWSESFWTPVGYTWDDLNQEKIPGYPDHRDIVTYPIVFSIIMLILKKTIVQPLVISPIAHKFGLPYRKHRSPIKNTELETLFRQFGTRLPKDVLAQASSSLGWSSRKIERWLRRKQASLKQTKHDKFVDIAYNWMYKTGITLFGCLVLYNKPYTWDLTKCWENFPNQAVDEGIWWFYMIGISFYGSQTVLAISQPHKKDSIVMIVHHAITITLMTFSWIMNCVRMGALILILHEMNDVLLLLSKGFRYFNKEKATDISFALFVVSWIVTRIYLYPAYILSNVYYDLPPHITPVPALIFFETLLCGIFVLNVNWLVMILLMAYRKIVSGEINDFRSSEEYDSNEDTEDFSD